MGILSLRLLTRTEEAIVAKGMLNLMKNMFSSILAKLVPWDLVLEEE